MYPWGHLAVGYLVYTIWSRLRFRRPPASGPTVALAIGTQLPDLIDKPLHLWFGIFHGRSIGHSLLTMVPLWMLVLGVASWYGYTQHAGAFGLGVFTHLLADARTALMLGRATDNASYLFWPLLPPTTYPQESIMDHVLNLGQLVAEIDFSSPEAALANRLVLGLVLSFVLLAVWVYDGTPGIDSIRRVATRKW